MKSEFLRIHPENPEMRKISKAVDILRRGGIIIYPTDTVYGMGCDLMNKKAINRLLKIKGLKPKDFNFSFICEDLSQVSEFAKQLDNQVFKILKRSLPGPFTFILNSSNRVPKILDQSKHTLGIRITDNNIVQAIIEELGNPIISTSIKDKDEILEYTTNPEDIYDQYSHQVDCIIDGGISGNVPSSVIDCTKPEPEILREGAGDVDLIW